MAFYNEVHATKKYRLGTRRRDVAGNEYVYLKGITSTAVGSWVVYDEAFVTTLTGATSQGPLAVAMAAVDANTKYGWYGIFGVFTGKVVTGADNAACYVCATGGSLDNTDVSGDMVSNCFQRSATSSNAATFQIQYPHAHNAAFD